MTELPIKAIRLYALFILAENVVCRDNEQPAIKAQKTTRRAYYLSTDRERRS